MDYYVLLDFVTDLGYRLAMAGAETFRVEESIRRITEAYGIESEVFAIPNCITVSIEAATGKPLTRMRRVGYHGNDLDAVERYNDLSRKICREKPEPSEAVRWMEQTDASRITYKMPQLMLGNVIGASGFAVLYGGSLSDCFCAGICGFVAGLVNYYMDKLKANQFFRIIFAAFALSVPAYLLAQFGIARSADATIIGALMILVPGLIFTNAMRDIIYGDTNSGINRIVQVFLIAAAIAMGTAAAWQVLNSFFVLTPSLPPLHHNLLIHSIASLAACTGFAILFNIHGHGMFLCALGGFLTWLIYLMIFEARGNDIPAYFWSTIFAATYAESMARVRKCPAIAYLVVAIFPLIPGSGIYYTMNCAVQGDMANFATKGTHTIAIAGVIAVGILLSSTLARIITSRMQKKHC